MLEESKKCIESPYYFATKYLKVKNHLGELVSFTTTLTEKEFNNLVNRKSPAS